MGWYGSCGKSRTCSFIDPRGILAATVIAAAVLLVSYPASALLCKDEKNGGGVLSCDMSYYHTEVKCHSPYKKLPDGETSGTTSPCPKEPIPMKDTEQKSFIKDFSPLLFAYPRDKDNPDEPYTGKYYAGTANDRATVLGMLGTKSPETSTQPTVPGQPKPTTEQKRFAQCVGQISLKGASLADQAKIVRLQLDNCANQYILQSAVAQGDETKKQDTKVLSGENPDKPEERISLKTHCQPLKVKPDVEQEYNAGYYIKLAWEKLLKNPDKVDSKRPAEPRIPGLSLQNPIDYPSDATNVTLADISKVKYEEINDPSHPFSPRWDYEYNEREKYSPKTVDYSGDSENSVFCAGDRKKNIIRVDILKFREEATKFDSKITKRIEWNKNCKANTGLQANPCCKPNLLTQTCEVKPCSECYDVDWKTDPVCSTSYSQATDRKDIKKKLLPVHPTLRFTGLTNVAGNLQGMALSNLPANVPTGAVTSMLSSQAGLLSSLPANLPISSALPMLSGQAGLLSRLPTNLPLGSLGSVMNMPAAMLQSLPANLPLNQVQGLLNSQALIMNVLPSNMPLPQALSSVTSLNGIMSALPISTPINQVTSIINAQNVFMNGLPQGMNVSQAAVLISQQAGGLTGITGSLPIGNAIPILQSRGIDVAGLAQLPAGMTVGDVRSMQAGLTQGATSFAASSGGASAPVASFASTIATQSTIMQQLPSGIPVSQAGAVLSTIQQGMPNLGNMAMSQVGNVLRAQAGSILQLPQTMIPSQISSIYRSTGTMLGQISSIPNMGIGQVQGMLQSQLGNLAGLGNIPIGNVTSMMQSQLGGITGILSGSGLPGFGGLGGGGLGGIGAVNHLSPIGSISTAVDASTLNSVAGGVGGADSVVSSVKPGTKLPLPVVLGLPYPRTAMCDPKEFTPNSHKVEDLCAELRKPFTPLNKLKMRYHNPDDPENDVLYEGVPEGLTFKDYFKNRMPYPRLWDAGQSIQKNNVGDSNAKEQDPLDDAGQYTAIVGIGREGAPKAKQGQQSTGDKKPPTDQRCRYGGWGGAVNFAGISIPENNPITSWTELKLVQARSIRDYQLSCLPRYEKMFKPGSTEALPLLKTGANWNSVYVSCPKADGSFEYKTVEEAKASGQACAAIGNNSASYDLKQEGWANAWRGYFGTKDASVEFPKFGGGADAGITGLDNAHCGDVVLLDNIKDADGKPTLPKLAVVTAVNLPKKSSCDEKAPPSNCVKEKNCYVDVIEYDTGKWPDACGTTDTLHAAKTRRYWNPGMYPSQYSDELEGEIKWTSACAESKITPCKMNEWSTLKLYRISDDVRKGATPSGTGN